MNGIAAREGTLDHAHIYVPGQWHCLKCGYIEMRSVLSVADGEMKVNPTAPLPCPNDGEYLERLTWRGYAEDLQKMLKDSLSRSLTPDEARIILSRLTHDGGTQIPRAVLWDAMEKLRRASAGK